MGTVSDIRGRRERRSGELSTGSVVAVLVVALLALGGTLPRADPADARDRRPTLVMFHAGGYVMGSTELLKRAAEEAREHGFRVVKVDYRLVDLRGAYRDAVRAARSAPGPVFAYGESAGGGLAARVAQRGLARAAYALSPEADVVADADARFPDDEASEEAWYGTEADQRLVSPLYHRTAVPIVATYSEEGGLPGFQESIEEWAARDGMVRVVPSPGGHIGKGAYGRVMGRAMGWLERRALRPPERAEPPPPVGMLDATASLARAV